MSKTCAANCNELPAEKSAVCEFHKTHGSGEPHPNQSKRHLAARIREMCKVDLRPVGSVYSISLKQAEALASAWLEDLEKARLEGVITTHDTYWHSQRMVDAEGIGPIALRRKERAEAALAALTNKSKEQ